MNALQFDLSGLREKGSLTFARQIEPQSLQPLLAGSAVFKGPLSLRLEILPQPGGVTFHGEVSGQWEIACARCLGPARLPFEAGVEGDVPGAGESLDASEEVRQALHLVLPLNARCKPDCKGLCPQCGCNRNEGKCVCQPSEFSARR
ncbi:MAG TPA: hypothetical protein DEB40_08405 [Elusimicrobia bacterium]|nr:hypothetical protein [Elusimicrobiota bacterium]HBT61750.1 hypothetical protein [Elusimicrobiota bacterium]